MTTLLMKMPLEEKIKTKEVIIMIRRYRHKVSLFYKKGTIS